MPSIRAMLMRLNLQLTKPFARFAGIPAARKGQDALGKISASVLKTMVSYRDVPFEGFSCCFATPVECTTADSHIILYLHGGGYTAGELDYARGFGGVLAASTRVNTFCVAYRLAPEHKYPAAVDDAMQAYRYLLGLGYLPEHIAFVGESAGGGLSFCLALRCRDEGMPLPSCIVGISPWTDLTLSGNSYSNNVRRDPSLIRESLAYYALVYAAGKETSPYVSPLHGEFSGFPPTLLFVGGSEILLDDSRSLYQKLLDAGCDATLHVEPHMWHVYPLYGLPESRRAVKMMTEFILERLGLQSVHA